MRINDTKEYFGKSYTAVEYTEPLDFQPTDDDPQCKICEPVLDKCLVSLYKEMKAKEKEGKDGNEA